jgi:hypothetical protein
MCGRSSDGLGADDSRMLRSSDSFPQDQARNTHESLSSAASETSLSHEIPILIEHSVLCMYLILCQLTDTTGERDITNNVPTSTSKSFSQLGKRGLSLEEPCQLNLKLRMLWTFNFDLSTDRSPTVVGDARLTDWLAFFSKTLLTTVPEKRKRLNPLEIKAWYGGSHTSHFLNLGAKVRCMNSAKSAPKVEELAWKDANYHGRQEKSGRLG